MSDLRTEVLELEALLKTKRRLLFYNRLKAMIQPDGLTDVQINAEAGAWSITYTHETNKYSEQNYAPDTPDHTQDYTHKKTTVTFGKNRKYFITGDRFKIYRNSRNELRVIIKDYDVEFDIEEHTELVTRYAGSPDVPEAAALRFFLYIAEHDWDDDGIINHFTIV